MAQGYKYGGPGGNNGNFNPNRTTGSTVQGFKHQGVPSAPYNLRYEARSQQEVDVYWKLPTGQDITSVNVELYQQQGWFGGWEKTDEGNLNGSTETVTVENKVLQLHIRAVNRFGKSEAAIIKYG
uniref:Fibronectin type-III domain-containing protein n=1 Tax=Branchiostoma floridae TaxID=7739 RepID=C3YRC6_BRAFL|eukprot:XP_002601111.1 hypothetical protein BRAFLDRAFT_75560 [Branchiostoma floridae]